MPRYFFHIYDDIVMKDDEGLELADAEAARDQALKGAREMMCEQMRQGRLNLHHRIEIEDEAGTIVLRLGFGEAVTFEPEIKAR